jgi:epoxyqueuosine reductase
VTLEAALGAEGLGILGGFHPVPADKAPEDSRTLLLVGPAPPRFWPRFAASPEACDGAPDPLDRWTVRVLGKLAEAHGARALYPFGGPPWHPFIAWAERTGRVWPSPVGLLVHAERGLWASFRGALAFPDERPLPPPAPRPCDACPAPCRAACPAGALTASGYDIPACRAWIERPEADCLSLGCAVRRACPVGRDEAPPPEQRAFHMAAFRGRQRA